MDLKKIYIYNIHACIYIIYIRVYIYIYVTGFAKRGLPHTSDLQTSTIHNFRCVKAMGLQIYSLEY